MDAGIGKLYARAGGGHDGEYEPYGGDYGRPLRSGPGLVFVSGGIRNTAKVTSFSVGGLELVAALFKRP